MGDANAVDAIGQLLDANPHIWHGIDGETCQAMRSVRKWLCGLGPPKHLVDSRR